MSQGITPDAGEDSQSSKDRNQWYIASPDTVVGPTSKAKIALALEAGELGSDALVWGPEIKGWQTLKATPLFGVGNFVVDGDAISPAFIERVASDSGVARDDSQEEGVQRSPSFELSHLSLVESPVVDGAEQLVSLSDVRPSVAPPSPEVALRPKRSNGLWLAAFVAGIAGVFATGLIAMRSYHSVAWSIPLAQGERDRLEATLARMPGAPVAAVSYSPDSILSPRLAVAVGDPAVSRVVVGVRGLAGTLLGAYRFELDIPVDLSRGQGVTDAIRQPNGSALAPGYYLVDIICASCTEQKSLGRETYFWGGVDGQGYRTDLVRYQRRLAERSKVELEEIRQLAETVRNQLSESLAEFERAIARVNDPAAISAWSKFSAGWVSFQGQLTTLIESQDRPESLQVGAYRALRRMAHQVSSVHREQSVALTGTGEGAPRSVVAMRSREVGGQLDAWLKRVRTTELNPTDSNGRPVLIGEGE